MVTYYHTTDKGSQSMIRNRGICPRAQLPKSAKRLSTLDARAVYVTDHLGHAASFGTYGLDKIVYKITQLPKNCRVVPDPEFGFHEGDRGIWAWKIKGCGCVKPQDKCEFNDHDINKAKMGDTFENTEKWLRANCEWVKV